MLFRSIQTSLVVIVVAIVAVTTTVVSVVAVQKHEASFLLLSKKAATGATRSLAYQLTRAPEAKDAQTVIDSMSLFPNIIYAKYTSHSGYVKHEFISLFDEQKRERARQSVDVFSPETPQGTYVKNDCLVSIWDLDGDNLGRVTVVSDFSGPMQASRKTLLFGLMPIVALVTLFVVVGTIWLLNRINFPLLQLRDFTKRVQEESDYSLRTPVKGSIEFQGLQQNINKLMDTISHELDKNEKNTKELLKQQQAMSKLANYDSLTSLPNRQFVMDSLRLDLARAKRSGQNISLLFFDLDGFKNINDSLGHETGDKLLIAVAQRVQSVLREGDLVARLGGDEFLIVPDRKKAFDDNESIELARKLLSAFQESFPIDGLDLQVGLSIGIANAKQAEFELNELVSNADMAMYRSKASGRGTYTVFEQNMLGDTKRKLEISNQIIPSLEAGDFKIAYQPKINASAKVVGFEALIRWVHPVLGEIGPSEFIPIAEQGGNIHALTAWVISKVFSQANMLITLSNSDIKVSLNLSAHDLHNPDLYQHIVNMLKKNNVKARNIELEVTESALLESFSVSNRFFKKISLLGCSIALDDFGTGYSSLSYLTQMKVDKLKIDRQFILELDSSERSRLVTRTIIDLAKRLDLATCAEGIENQFQQDYLLTHGCNEFQGFFYGSAQLIEDINESTLNFQSQFKQHSQQYIPEF